MKVANWRWLRLLYPTILLLTLLLPFIMPANVLVTYAAGNTYYVATTGSDSAGNGTLANPWRTIQIGVSNLTAGDTLYVMNGTYNETVLFTSSGNDSNWITLKNYNKENVAINGSGLSATNAIVSGYAQHHIIIDGLTIFNAGNVTNNMAGIYFGTYAAGSTGDFIVRNTTIYNTWNSGILINSSWSAPTGNKIDNVTIDNVTVHDTNIGGNNEAISLIEVDTFEIKNSLIYDVQGQDSGIGVQKEGIDAKVGCINGTIHDNEIYNAKIGIYVDAFGAASSNISIYNNDVHENNDVGISVRSETGAAVVMSSINIYNNLIYNNATGFDTMTEGALTLTFNLLNNTFYNNGSDFEVNLFTTGMTYSNTVIRNNIFYNSGGSGVGLLINTNPGVTIDHNLFFDTAYNPANAYGTEYLQTDPIFASATDYTLQEKSPAIGTGSSIGAYATDYNGVSRPQGVAYDIGAYEYQTTSPSYTDTALPNSTNIPTIYIWRNVLEPNDYLVVAQEDVNYTSIPTTDISETFLFRYLSNNLSVDYGDIQAYPYYNSGYGKGVISFYFPSASNMTWQGQYQIQIQGKVSAFTNPPAYNYQVAAGSYYSGTNTTTAIRSDMTTKILSLADTLDTAWGDNYTLTTSYDTRRVFSSQGEAYFRMAIPGIQEMCPDLFLTAIGDPPADNTTWTQNESNEWATTINGTAFGQQGIQTLADLFSVSFLTFAAIPVLVVCGVLLLVGAMTGSVLSGLMNSSLVIVASSYYGWFPPIAMIIVAFGAAVYSLWHFFGKHGG